MDNIFIFINCPKFAYIAFHVLTQLSVYDNMVPITVQWRFCFGG